MKRYVRTALKSMTFAAPVASLATVPAFADDPLATLVAGISFANLETDIVTVGVALASLYIVWVGIHWILRMIRHG